jgi:hypothetical protein
MGARRRTISVGGALCASVLAFTVSACHSGAHVNAPHAPTPVTLGPVRCIGCRAESASASGAKAEGIEDESSGHGGGYVVPVVFWVFYGTWQTVTPTRLGLVSAKAISDLCRDDVHISKLKASAASAFALFFWDYGVGTDTTAGKQTRNDGVCPPASWPFAGPNGIVYVGKPTADPKQSGASPQLPNPAPALPPPVAPAEPSSAPNSASSPTSEPGPGQGKRQQPAAGGGSWEKAP